MMSKKTLTMIIRILEECLENDYSAEELRSKIQDILRLLGVDHCQLSIVNEE